MMHASGGFALDTIMNDPEEDTESVTSEVQEDVPDQEICARLNAAGTEQQLLEVRSTS